ncbi:MAG: hypothetical protein ACKO37_09540 [Vampirovibrionales bacterium]
MLLIRRGGWHPPDGASVPTPKQPNQNTLSPWGEGRVRGYPTTHHGIPQGYPLPPAMATGGWYPPLQIVLLKTLGRVGMYVV